MSVQDCLREFSEDWNILKKKWQVKKDDEQESYLFKALSDVLVAYEANLQELKKKQAILVQSIHDDAKLLMEMGEQVAVTEKTIARLKDRIGGKV